MRRLLFASTVFTLQLSLGSSAEVSLFSNLPIGEYRGDFRSVYSCDPTKDYKIQFNHYVIRNSKNLTALKGNVTAKIPFDDSLWMEVNVAMQEPNNGWRENLLIQKMPAACSAIKNIMGQKWIQFLNGLGIRKNACPVAQGIYITPGLDFSIMKNSNLPKSFFYGIFRLRIAYTLKKETVSCTLYTVEIKRR